MTGKGFGVRCERLERGQRAYCSNRGRRGGCGRTFAIYLSGVVPRHSVDAPALSRLFAGLLAGLSLKATAEALRAPFALETFYHARARLRLRLDALRVLLCRETGPPSCAFADPLLQTLAHLRGASSSAPSAAVFYCRIAAARRRRIRFSDTRQHALAMRRLRRRAPGSLPHEKSHRLPETARPRGH